MARSSKRSSSAATASPQSRLRALSLWAQTFLPYQARWIAERRNSVAIKARQIGFSFSSAGKLVARGFANRRTQLIVSAREELAAEVLRVARQHCHVLHDLGLTEAAQFAVDNSDELAWKTGGRIIALPANPNTARGYSGDVFLDEYAYVEHAEGIRDALFPIVSRGGLSLDVASTPNGGGGPFHELVTNTPAGWGLHRVTIYDAERDGFPVDRAKLMALCGGDERLFAQWYLCEFLDADLQYIPTGLVERARIDALPSLDGCEIYAGIDVGREHDLTVITIVAVAPNDRAFLLDQVTCKRTKFAQQRELFSRLRKTYRWQRVCIDSTGLGSQLAEELVDLWGDDEVEALPFTLQSKEDLATRLLRFLREEKLKMRQTEETKHLAGELVALRRVVQPSGRVVYESPRTAKGHGDRAWSLALALRAADQGAIPRGMGKSPLFAVA